MSRYLIMRADEFTPMIELSRWHSKQDAEQEVDKLQSKSIQYDEFTYFFVIDSQEDFK